MITYELLNLGLSFLTLLLLTTPIPDDENVEELVATLVLLFVVLNFISNLLSILFPI